MERKPATYPKVMIWPGDRVVATRSLGTGTGLYVELLEGVEGVVVSVVWTVHSVSYVVDFRGVARRSCTPDDIGLVLEDEP